VGEDYAGEQLPVRSTSSREKASQVVRPLPFGEEAVNWGVFGCPPAWGSCFKLEEGRSKLELHRKGRAVRTSRK